MQWLKNLRMKKKLLLLIALPLLLSLGFASQALISNYEKMKEASIGKSWIELITSLDYLMDQLQKEGQLSIQIVSQNTPQASNQLMQIREQTLMAVHGFKDKLAELHWTLEGTSFEPLFKQIIDDLDRLHSFRLQINNKSISSEDIDSYFNQFENSFTQIIAQLRNNIGLTTFIRLILNVLFIKEEVNAFDQIISLIEEARQGIKDDLIHRILLNIGRQENAHQNFIYLLHPSHRAFYYDLIKNENLEEINHLKSSIFQLQANQFNDPTLFDRWLVIINDRIESLNFLKNQFLNLLHNEGIKIVKATKMNLFTIGLFFIAFAITTYLITSIVVKTIISSLENAVFVAKQVSRGNLKDLKLDCRTSRGDEIGDLERALCIMVDTLHTLNRDLKQEIDLLAQSGTEILSSINQASSGTSEIATALTETSTTMEELKQTSHISSEKAKDVLHSTEQAVSTLQSSESSLQSTLNDMHNIHTRMKTIVESIIQLSKHSQAIGDIINTVNDLASQSNLLAVNAAIEAAKAGEQGKGFAVVAQEVRRLAEQSKEATAQVHTLLADIQNAISSVVMSAEQGTKAVEQGVEQSSKTSEELRLLSIDINEFKRAADQITVSSDQQLIGIDQVSIAMNNIKEASNQHVIHVQQIKQAVNTLNDISQYLIKAVEQYKV